MPEVFNLSAIAIQAREAIAGYLESHWPTQPELLPREEIERQRLLFVADFSPDRLASLSSGELLTLVPLNQEHRLSMDYCLERRVDDEFNTRIFGSIMGGSAAKFGVWQEPKTNRWRIAEGAKIRYASEEEARAAVQSRVDEALAAYEFVSQFRATPIDEIDPIEFHRGIEEAAPTGISRAWLHKYLSLTCPELISWSATVNFSRSQLYRVGVPAPDTLGLYALDIVLLRFWTSIPALKDVPRDYVWRISEGHNPRSHMLLRETNPELRMKMLSEGFIGMGPKEPGELSSGLDFKTKRDVMTWVRVAFEQCSVDDAENQIKGLTDFLTFFEEGAVVGLVGDTNQAVAVGRITGSYRFDAASPLSHQKSIEWFHDTPLPLTKETKVKDKNTLRLRHDHPAVAELEASMVVAGRFNWPDFASDDRPGTFTPASPDAATTVTTNVAETARLPGLERPLADYRDALRRKGQLILYGPPGTGKTFHARSLARELVARKNFGVTAAMTKPFHHEIYGTKEEVGFIAFTTFHPMYAYEDFVEGFRPSKSGAFVEKAGIFKRMSEAAQAMPEKDFVLIIDEINRGNIPKIFGELITLLEVDKRSNLSVRLPLSGELFSVPRNLFLIGTMNTADRSIALLDTALRRRFAFQELMPDEAILGTAEVEGIRLSDLMRALNRGIVEHLGRDARSLQIGHSFFMHDAKAISSLERLRDVVRDDIWPLLQEYCYEDAIALGAILCRSGSGIYDEKRCKLRNRLFERGNENEFLRAVSLLIGEDDTDTSIEDEAPDVLIEEDDED